MNRKFYGQNGDSLNGHLEARAALGEAGNRRQVANKLLAHRPWTSPNILKMKYVVYLFHSVLLLD
jgi:hypothetical protein